MGRGEEEGGFFNSYLSRSSLSRHIRPQQKKNVHSTSDICNFFLLSSHFQSTFCLYIRPTFLSPLRCIALFMYFSSSVFSSLFIAFNV